MALFASDEWVGLLMEEVNSDMDLPGAGKGLDARIQFTVKGAGNGEASFWAHMKNGRFVDASSGRNDGCEYSLSGDYGTWRDIIEGGQDPLRAIMDRQLAFEGNIQAVMKYVKAVSLVIDCAKRVPTSFG